MFLGDVRECHYVRAKAHMKRERDCPLETTTGNKRLSFKQEERGNARAARIWKSALVACNTAECMVESTQRTQRCEARVPAVALQYSSTVLYYDSDFACVKGSQCCIERSHEAMAQENLPQNSHTIRFIHIRNSVVHTRHKFTQSTTTTVHSRYGIIQSKQTT